MPQPPRREIDELISVYELESQPRDIVVEGVNDAALLAPTMTDSRVNVYAVETIEVPFGLLQRFGQPDNNRGRVIGFARALCERAGCDLSGRVACVVDADYDYLADALPDYGPLVVRTDHANMPMYGYDPETFDVLLRRGMGLNVESASIFCSVDLVVREVFLLKAAAHQLRLKFDAIPIQRVCDISGNTIEFDRAEFVGRTLNKEGLTGEATSVLSAADGLRARAVERLHANSHDVADLLSWFLRLTANRSVTAEIMEMMWRTATSSERLRRSGLVEEILRRFS